jgi:hypothetical protein
MKQKRPGGLKASYEVAYRKAYQRVATDDLAEICRRSGATLNGRRIKLSFFGAGVEILASEQERREDEGNPIEGLVTFEPADLPLIEKILVLHYLLGQQSRPTRGVMVAFKNLPGAAFYDPTYQKRGPKHISRRFGASEESFRKACRSLGWRETELGDAAFEFDIFPKIRAVVVLYTGDEELPAEANILFNDEIGNFLSLEDVAVLAGSIATRLSKAG